MHSHDESTVSIKTAAVAVFLALIAFVFLLLTFDVSQNGGFNDGEELIKIVDVHDSQTRFFYFNDAARRSVKLVSSPRQVPTLNRNLVILAEPGMKTPLEKDRVYVIDLGTPIGGGRYRAHLMDIGKVLTMAEIEAQMLKEARMRSNEGYRQMPPSDGLPPGMEMPQLQPGQLAPEMPMHQLPEGAPPLPAANLGRELSRCDSLRDNPSAYTDCVNSALQ